MMLNKTKLGMALVTALVLTTGCEQQQTAEQDLVTAKTYITSKENDKAVIALKNALSKNQTLDEARLLLGQLYLSNGEFLAAEIEFNKLYNTDYPSTQLIVDLAKARYLQQEFDTIPDLWQTQPELSSAQIAQLGFYTYIALKRADDTEQLNQLTQALIPAKQDQTYTKLIIAYEQVEQQQVDEALNTVNTILLAEPKNLDALLFKGQIHSFKGEYEDATTAFELFLEDMRNYILVELYLADVLFKNTQFEKAAPLVNQLVSKAPNFGYTNYLQGMLLFTQNQFEESKLYLEKAVQAKVNVEQAKLYAGLSAYRSENYEQAYEYLTEVIDQVPNNDELRRLLSVVQFKLGYSIEASDSIAKLTELSERDLSLANSASFNYIQRGQVDKAKEVIAQTSKVDTDNALELAKLGMLKVSLQDMSGIVDIKRAIELDSNAEQAKVALVQAYLGQGLADDAMEVAKLWIKDEPDNINAYNLAGFVAVQKRDKELAESYLTKALEFNENNSASLMFLAGKARSEGDLAGASKYLSSLITTNPNYLPGLINNYLIAKQMGSVTDAVELFRLASVNSPNNQPLQMAYARVLYTEKMYDQAIGFLKAMPSSISHEYRWLALLDSMLKMGRYSEARENIGGWLKSFPKSEMAWSAALQLDGLKNPKTSIPLLNRAIQTYGEHPLLFVHLAEQYVKVRKVNDAKSILTEQLSAYAQDPKVVVLTAKLHLIEDEAEEANTLLKAAYSEDCKPDFAILFAESYRKLGNAEQALKIIETSLVNYPENIGLLFNKGTLYKNIDIDESIKIYNKALSIEPESVVTLNNLANAYISVESFQLGYETAKAAVELAPNIVAVQSTMANAAKSFGKTQEAEKIYARLWLATKSNEYLEQFMRLTKIESREAAIAKANQVRF